MTTQPLVAASPNSSSSTRPRRATTAKARRPRRRVNRGHSLDQLPSGKWRVRWTDETGKRRTRTFESHARADDFAATIKADALRGEWRDPDAGAVSLADYARRWLEVGDHRPRTRRLYDDLLHRYIESDLEFRPATGGRARTVNLGRRHLNKLTPDDVREWHAATRDLAERGALAKAQQRASTDAAGIKRAARAWAIREGRAVSTTGRLPAGLVEEWEAAGRPTAVGTYTEDGRADRRSPGDARARQAYQLLHAILTTAVDDRRILTNPCRIKGAGQARTPQKVIPTAEQVHALADVMPARLRAAVLLSAYSGLRPGEVFALARRHLNLSAGTVRVERTLDPDTLSFGPPKTDAGRRTVALPPFIVDELRAHLAKHVERTGDALLFATATGRPLPGSRRSEALRRARAVVGCNEVGWHDLRHYAATTAAQVGATTRELQARIGHSTPAAAMHYQHATATRDQEIAARLEHMRPDATPPNVTAIHARTA